MRGGWGIYYGRSSNSVISSALTNNAVRSRPTTSRRHRPARRHIRASSRAPPSGHGSAVDSVPLAVARTPRDQHGGTDGRPRGRHGHHGLGVVSVQRAAHTCPTFLDTNLNPPNSTVEFFVGGESRGTFPFFRGARPDANINNAIEVADIVESTYNALVLQANKRFNKGLLFNANYTLSKSEDTGQNSTTFISNFATMVDPFNNDAEKGPSSFDRRHRGVVSVHYAPDFLWGFQFGGTGTFESGLPLNPTISINSGALNGNGRREHGQRQRHRRLQPRAVGHAQRLPPDGPQDDRHAALESVQRLAAADSSRRCGKPSTS